MNIYVHTYLYLTSIHLSTHPPTQPCIHPTNPSIHQCMHADMYICLPASLPAYLPAHLPRCLHLPDFLSATLRYCLMIQILHYLKDPQLRELWVIPFLVVMLRICIINHKASRIALGGFKGLGSDSRSSGLRVWVSAGLGAEFQFFGGFSLLWFLVGNGGMDPYDSPLRSPIVVPKTHSSIP